MKRIFHISTAFLFLFGFRANAQQASHYSHFVTNHLMLNPAVAGSAPCLDLKLGYRMQWQGFEGAPRTAFGAIQGVLGDKQKRNFHGLGAIVETDDTGPLSFTSIHVLYAYHMKVSRKAMLSLGVGVGFMQYRVDYGGLVLNSFDDPIIQSSSAEFIWPQINTGLWLYREDRFIGLAFRNVTNNRLKNFSDPSEAESRIHVSATAGKVVDMNDDFRFRPAVQIRYTGRAPLAFDIQGMLDYNSKVALGAGFRNGQYLVALAKVDLFDYITLAYAYDLSANRVRFASPHTHEVTLGIQACPKGGYGNRVPCSAYD